MNKLVKKIRYIKISDIIAPVIFLSILIPSVIMKFINRLKKKSVWLICEDGKTARDNGYYFFKYIKSNYPEQNCFYVIDKNSSDYEKLKQYRDVVQFKSLRHWLLYLVADYNISIHKHGNPCQSFFYIIHVLLGLYNNRVFLQHGITKDDSPWIYYKNTKFKYFICGAKKEYEYVKSKFGYLPNNVLYTGFPRFDNLHDNIVNQNQILIMPTWRNWLGGNYLTEKKFAQTEYFTVWNGLINNEEFINFIEKNGITVFFYPHQHVQKFIYLFKSKSSNIMIVDNSKNDIQKLLKESQLLITDYSSVFMDFAYMNKPILYYQFDYKEYREKQLQEGYFSYKDDGFGSIVYSDEELLDRIKYYKFNNYEVEDKYKKRMLDFFELHDNNNSERIYEILKKGEK